MNTDWLTIAMQVMEDLFEGIKLIPQRCGLSLFDPVKHLPLQGLHGTFISIHAEGKPFLVVVGLEIRVIFYYLAGHVCESLILFIHVVCKY